MLACKSLFALCLLSAAALGAPPETGLRGEYVAARNFSTLGAIRLVGPIDFTFDKSAPYEGKKLPEFRAGHYENYSIRWTGRIVPRYTETYTLRVTVDDGALLWVDGRLLVRAWKDQGPTEYIAQLGLTANKPARVKLLYYN